MSGWIKLHRNLKDWEYYDDHNATRLLIHLLVSVNYEDKKWKETTVKAGTMVSSWQHLAHETGLSLKQIRLAMSKLERAGEAVRQVAGKGAGKWQVISLVKWDKMQGFDDSEGQDKGQAKGRSRVGKKTPTKEIKKQEEKKEELITLTTIVDNVITPTKKFIIPSIDEIKSYCLERNNQINPEQFYDHYQSNGWKVGKNSMKDWKASIRTWEKNNYSSNQNKSLNTPKEYEPNAHVLKIINRLHKDGNLTDKQAEVARITIANSPTTINVQQLMDGVAGLKRIGDDFDIVNFRNSLRIE
jgi:predicted DNA binding protein